MPIATAQKVRRMRLPGEFELLYLGPVLLHARIVAHFAKAQHRRCLVGPLADTKAALDSLQVAAMPVPMAYGRPAIT
eukprot:2051154-Pyramimonas_sp.AAC.1